MNKETVLVLDFGGQYASLLARRVRECGIYCEIHSYQKAEEAINEINPAGIILSGGPQSVYSKNSAKIKKDILPDGVPVLGVCYGAQLLAILFGGAVKVSPKPEYGVADTQFNTKNIIFEGIKSKGVTWMSHTDFIFNVPADFVITASTENCPCAAMENAAQKIYALQFHPEVTNTESGKAILENFLYKICGLKRAWKMESFIDSQIEALRTQAGNKNVVLGLSGGVDSSVCAALLSRAIGKNLTCIFVDHGLMRKEEGDETERAFSGMDMRFIRVDASERFLSALKGIREPERKRKIIGTEFVRVFEEEASKINAEILAQGTIYPDVIESGLSGGAVIKSHHNVGGLPKESRFRQIIEPLRNLFKDEVREVGKLLGLTDAFVFRQPFPGPGLAVRIIGIITKEKLDILREADAVFCSVLSDSGIEKDIHQYFAVMTGGKSVGVMGDGRSYGHTVALRAVVTSDFMTADFARIPYDILAKASSRIVNEVKGVNRVVYDITTKPPATIEWE